MPTIPDLVRIAERESTALTGKDTTLLGAYAYFIALKTYGRSPNGNVLRTASRALDSFDPRLTSRTRNAAFQHGIRQLSEALFPIRGESHEVLIAAAGHWLCSNPADRARVS